MIEGAELLRTAAAVVRGRAAHTSLAPWAKPLQQEEVPGWPFWMLHNGGVGMKEHAVAATFELSPNQEADALWMSFMSPHVAEPLAKWLDHAAERMEVYDEEYPPDGNSGLLALILAEALLGEATS